MKHHPLARMCINFALLAAMCTASQANAWQARIDSSVEAQKNLRPFTSDQELETWLNQKKIAFQKEFARHEKENRLWRLSNNKSSAESLDMAGVGNVVTPSPVADASESESVTNAQTAGVDEGGIVKVHGDYLVILRRGRLFTVDVSGNNLQPVSIIDAFAPGATVNTWYDEMLIAGDTIIVISYSYALGGTEVTLFNINKRGQLSYKSTHALRSHDYYSSRNYASRIIGDKLVFYTPLYLNFHGNPLESFPAIRQWRNNAATTFKPIAPATKVYRVDDDLDPYHGIALHTVQVCDLSADDLNCTASGVLGPAGLSFMCRKMPFTSGRHPFSATTATVVRRLIPNLCILLFSAYLLILRWLPHP